MKPLRRRRLQAYSLELVGDRLTVRLTDRTPLTPAVATALHAKTGGGLSLVGSDRVVARLPPARGASRIEQLRAAQAALGELVMHAGGRA